MSDEAEIIVEILREIFGKEKQHYENRLQISFNCPVCDEGRNKGNLEINYGLHVFKCWSCGDYNEMHGPIGKLIDTFGSKKQKKTYKLFQPEQFKPKEKVKKKLLLPEGFTKFKDSHPRYPIRNQALNYLKNRNITDEMIEKYSIGFCDKGDFNGRIIIPSFDLNGELNYFIARSWDAKSKVKYKNPQQEKDKIIFNEGLIDWDKDIFLVEGVFDGLFLENSIPMLGKHLSSLLFETLYTKAKKDIIIATDGDAWYDGVKIYNELNGGDLYGRVKIIKLPKDKDVCDLQGNIQEYYFEIK